MKRWLASAALLDIMIPCIDRCAGFLLYDMQTRPAVGAEYIYRLDFSDDDIGSQVERRLAMAGVPLASLKNDGLHDALDTADSELLLMFRVQQADDMWGTLAKEMPLCTGAMSPRADADQYTSPNTFMRMNNMAYLTATPSTLMGVVASQVFITFGVNRRDVGPGAPNVHRPSPEVTGFGPHEWILYDESFDNMSDSSYRNNVGSSTGSAGLSGIPGMVRMMLTLLRGKQYYVLVVMSSPSSGEMRVVLPATEHGQSLDGMADICARQLLAMYAAGSRTLEGMSNDCSYDGLSVFVSKAMPMALNNMWSTQLWIMGAKGYDVQDDSIKQGTWCSANDSVMPILREAKERDSSAWFRR